MIRTRILPTRKQNTISIPFLGETNLAVSVGEEVVVGQKLFESNVKKIQDSYYLPQILGVKVERSGDYVGRISGEYVSKGELLAEKLTAAGMLGKRVLAGVDGVINLDRIHQGYIDILGEEITQEHFSKISGKIVGINLGNSITIETDCGEIDYLCGFNLENAGNPKIDEISGEFVIIEKGDSVYTEKSLADSYEGKIVYTGRYLYPDLAREIQRRGANAIVTYSSDYDNVERLNFPVVVVGGFGQIKLNLDILLLFQDSVGHYVKIDPTNKIISFSNKGKAPDSSDFKGVYYFSSNLEVGNSVMSVSPESYGQIGIVMEIIRNDEGEQDSVVVHFSSDKKLLFKMDQLEQYIPIV